MGLSIYLCNHQRVSATKLLKSLYPTAHIKNIMIRAVQMWHRFVSHTIHWQICKKDMFYQIIVIHFFQANFWELVVRTMPHIYIWLVL